MVEGDGVKVDDCFLTFGGSFWDDFEVLECIDGDRLWDDSGVRDCNDGIGVGERI